MKYLSFVLGCFGVVAGMTTPVRAQNYPWCVIYGGDGGGATNCGFTTHEQCMARIDSNNLEVLLAVLTEEAGTRSGGEPVMGGQGRGAPLDCGLSE